MNIMRCRTIIILALVLGMGVSVGVLAQDVEVNSVDPMSALQGTFNLDVTINGAGFDKSAEVKFFKTGTNDPAGITVNNSRAQGPFKIIANIDIADTAESVAFDVEISMSRGRGGKGTALFNVVEKKEFYYCHEVFALSSDSVCDCKFKPPAMSNQQGGPPTVVWEMLDNCYTKETLQLAQFDELTSGDKTLTAKAPFTGSTVVAISGNRAAINHLNIEIDAGVDAGCAVDAYGDPTELRSAIGFVLDATSVDPATNGENSEFRRTWFSIISNTISTVDQALCHAIEINRTAAYDSAFPDVLNTDRQVHAQLNVILAGSYEQTGILALGFNTTPNAVDPVVIGRNTIQPGLFADANAIQFGPITGEGSIDRNLISLGDGTGVLALGGGSDDLTFELNDISGAKFGILVDNQVPNAFFKGNILTGDLNRNDDIGICSDADTNTIRANKIKDYDDPFGAEEPNCTGLASPAN